jgi:Ca2+-dependent lipid-binding protein
MDRLVLKLYDHDTAQFDDFIGSIQFSIKDLLTKGEKPGGHFVWQNLYGAPGDLNNSMA